MFTSKPFRYGVLLAPALFLSSLPKAFADVIDFDFDPFGNPVPHLTLIDDLYASIGVHFTGGYYSARTSVAFPSYTVRPSPNYLCTFGGTTGGGNPNCLVPNVGDGRVLLGVQFDFPVVSASIEGFTRNDGPRDIDSLSIEAFDANGMSIGFFRDICSNDPAPHRIEGVCVASIQVPGIRSLLIDPNRDFLDALDTLTFERDETTPPPVAEPHTLALLGLGLLGLCLVLSRESRTGNIRKENGAGQLC